MAFVRFDDAAIEGSIAARFARQVDLHSGRLAVAAGDVMLAYRELDEAATGLAEAIAAEPGDEPVALLLGHGARLVAAILGALKAGRIYAALDPAASETRSAYVLADAGACLLLTDLAHVAQARRVAHAGVRVLLCEDVRPRGAGSGGPAIAPADGALLLYTSGSTAEPKGVLVSHEHILVEARTYTNDVRIVPDDRLALLHSASFANSIRNLYGALLNGASLHLYDLGAEGVAGLGPWMRESRITIVHTLATVFRRFAETLEPGTTFPALRVLRLGGESITGRDVRLFQRHFVPPCVLMHAMGPTETGTIRRHFITHGWRGGDGKVPVGDAVPDKEVLLLDEDRRQVPPGETGEIAVRSRYLAMGYWRRPELTAAAFVADPGGGPEPVYLTGDLGVMRPDGSLVHLGRKDFLVKIRGKRVEVEEVEAALQQTARVKAVAVHPDPGAGEPRLVAYVVPAPGPAPTVSELRRAVAPFLPEYMIPSAFVFLEALPTLPNGKVDRRALPAPGRERPPLDEPYVPPGTVIESILAGLWADALGLDQVGIHDDFLDLGGHSLLAGQLVARVTEAFRTPLTIQALLETPTVADMAAAIIARALETADAATVTRLLEGVEPPGTAPAALGG